MFRKSNAATAQAISKSVEALVGTLQTVSSVLPDISRFAAVEDIQRGVSMPAATLLGSLRVAAGFGLPLLALAYLFFRYKEVAP